MIRLFKTDFHLTFLAYDTNNTKAYFIALPDFKLDSGYGISFMQLERLYKLDFITHVENLESINGIKNIQEIIPEYFI